MCNIGIGLGFLIPVRIVKSDDEGEEAK